MLHSLQSSVEYYFVLLSVLIYCGYYNNSDFESDCGFEFSYNNCNCYESSVMSMST